MSSSPWCCTLAAKKCVPAYRPLKLRCGRTPLGLARRAVSRVTTLAFSPTIGSYIFCEQQNTLVCKHQCSRSKGRTPACDVPVAGCCISSVQPKRPSTRSSDDGVGGAHVTGVCGGRCTYIICCAQSITSSDIASSFWTVILSRMSSKRRCAWRPHIWQSPPWPSCDESHGMSSAAVDIGLSGEWTLDCGLTSCNLVVVILANGLPMAGNTIDNGVGGW